MLDTATITRITGCPFRNVDANWPILLHALDKAGINTPLVQVATIATVAVETPAFAPVSEKWASGYTPEQYFAKMYWLNKDVAHRLGNLNAADAAAFRGRGFIQITGRDNYEMYGDLLGLPLDKQPELALQAGVAADILAAFFKRQGVSDAANHKDWHRVRIRVNGGTNGWARFIDVVNGCL